MNNLIKNVLVLVIALGTTTFSFASEINEVLKDLPLQEIKDLIILIAMAFIILGS